MARKTVSIKQKRAEADAAAKTKKKKAATKTKASAKTKTKAKTKSAAKTATKTAAKTKAKRKSRKKVVAEVRLKAFWGVFNQSLKRVALYEYSQRRQADKKAADLTAKGKSPHFVQLVKEVIEEE